MAEKNISNMRSSFEEIKKIASKPHNLEFEQ